MKWGLGIARRVARASAGVVIAASCQGAITETFDLATATTADINRAFDAGALTSEKLVSMYLARIEAYEEKGPKINCIVSLSIGRINHLSA